MRVVVKTCYFLTICVVHTSTLIKGETNLWEREVISDKKTRFGEFDVDLYESDKTIPNFKDVFDESQWYSDMLQRQREEEATKLRSRGYYVSDDYYNNNDGTNNSVDDSESFSIWKPILLFFLVFLGIGVLILAVGAGLILRYCLRFHNNNSYRINNTTQSGRLFNAFLGSTQRDQLDLPPDYDTSVHSSRQSLQNEPPPSDRLDDSSTRVVVDVAGYGVALLPSYAEALANEDHWDQEDTKDDDRSSLNSGDTGGGGSND